MRPDMPDRRGWKSSPRSRFGNRVVLLLFVLTTFGGLFTSATPGTTSANQLNDAYAKQQALQKLIAKQKASIKSLSAGQAELASRISSTKSSLAAINANLLTVKTQIVGMTVDIAKSQNGVDELSATGVRLDAELAQIEADAATKQTELDASKVLLASRIREAYDTDRTAVPIEWDDFRQQLEKLTDSLQPTTPGGPSAVGEFVNTAADNLRGNGDTARDTVIKLSQAVSALGDHSTDIFSTVRNLQLLVSALSSSSDLLAAFNTNLADVTTVLSNSPDEIADATKGLDGAVNDLRGFVADNREGLGVTVDHLNAVTTALNGTSRLSCSNLPDAR